MSVQVAAMNFQDQKGLTIMKEIGECFNFHELTEIYCNLIWIYLEVVSS